MQNGAIYLYSGAALGTEYHEAFHMFFRNFLTEAQQAAIYEEAVQRYGEPTPQEIAKARRGQPVMTDAEAVLLALEEKMAEEMRDYALDQQKPQGIGRRLFKFFKDLFAYIKAVATNRVGIDQAFRMLETGRIPATLSRKTDAFSPSPAYLLEKFSDRPAHRNELTDVAIWKLINDLDKIPAADRAREAASALGTADGRQDSAIRNWFLRHAFNVEGRPLTDDEFVQLKEAFDTADDPVIDAIAQFGAPSVQIDGTPMPPQMLDTDANDVNTAADDFLQLYESWFDERSEVADGVYTTNHVDSEVRLLSVSRCTGILSQTLRQRTRQTRSELRKRTWRRESTLCLDSRRAQPRRSQSKQRDCCLVSQYNPRDNRTACTDSKHSYHCRMLCVSLQLQ